MTYITRSNIAFEEYNQYVVLWFKNFKINLDYKNI